MNSVYTMENKSLFDFYGEGRWRDGKERYCHDDFTMMDEVSRWVTSR